eukprot:scaffold2126_cov417-Prasinococcus_capsulatus_cf.AAC.12
MPKSGVLWRHAVHGPECSQLGEGMRSAARSLLARLARPRGRFDWAPGRRDAEPGTCTASCGSPPADPPAGTQVRGELDPGRTRARPGTTAESALGSAGPFSPQPNPLGSQ